MRNYYQNNYLKWKSLYSKFEDDESKANITHLIRYRYIGDFGFIENYKVRLNDQYFEDFMNYKNEIFVNTVVFDGYLT